MGVAAMSAWVVVGACYLLALLAVGHFFGCLLARRSAEIRSYEAIEGPAAPDTGRDEAGIDAPDREASAAGLSWSARN